MPSKKKTSPAARRRTSRRNEESPLSSTPKKVKSTLARIKVVGVGGGGGNAVSRMMEGERLRGVEFVAINTDKQDLDYALAHQKVYIGKALTHGLGAGMNPEIGKQAAEENRSEIGELLEDADILFLTAGMGGGTGTGAIPVIADIAREKGILTVAIVTKPFSFEGQQRAAIAQEGLQRLKEKVDALVVIPNDRVFSIIDKETPIMRAFGYIDDVLRHGVQAVSELINTPGIINVDFADIQATLRDAGATLIGTGIASGQDRGVKAVTAALNSPLLEVTVDGARGVLFSVAGGRDVKMGEIHEIARTVSSNLDPNARVIFGAYHDRTLKDKSIKVTVIATGFSGVLSQRSSAPSLFMAAEIPERLSEAARPAASASGESTPKASRGASSGQPGKGKEAESGRNPADDGGEWEIPAFLRKQRKREGK
jgi:cell division protein FtsZ